MTAKTSTHAYLPPIEWDERTLFKRVQQEPEVVELFDEEALIAWALATSLQEPVRNGGSGA